MQVTRLTEGPYTAKVSFKLIFPGSCDDFFTMDTAFSGEVFSAIAGFSSATLSSLSVPAPSSPGLLQAAFIAVRSDLVVLP